MIEPDALLAGEGHHRGALDPGRVRDAVVQSLRGDLVDGRKILVLTPDGTRTAPLPFMVRILAETVGVRAARMDFMVALGTHQPLSDPALLDLYGLTGADKQRLLPNSKLLNHRWDLADTLVRLGALSGRAIADLSEGRFKDPVDVTINGRLLDYDLILILGPVFPHEVAGFSGGTKYLFPGVSGGDFLHFTHWLGALATCWRTIGFPDTPVRRAIDRAAALLPVPVGCISMVVRNKTDLAGLYIGGADASWRAAAALSAKCHVVYKDRPFHTVVGRCPPMYDELWTGGKVMYKLEPVVADGGRLIVYAPELNKISTTWGGYLERIGYHVRDYFTAQMDRFQDVPLGVLAHSTHVKGLGRYEGGVESPRIEVILASGIPEATCRRINLGYMNPADVDPARFRDREDEGVLYVDPAGEILYRIAGDRGEG